MRFYVDGTGFIFALITSFVWLLATIYSVGYMTHEHARDRFFSFLILTLAVDLGVLLAGDLFSLFIFFELLGLSSWVLVIHTETPEAMKAGKKYLFMGVIGGLFLLFGIFLLFINTDTLVLQPLLDDLVHLGDIKYLIAATMTIGFGVKAGMFPLHVWLPEAHPVAPSPASALLSGIMVKAGIYGIIRTLLFTFSPTEAAEHLWHLMTPVGGLMIWIGIITMTLGMVLALLQTNLKRLLAYSTISQIGYIIFGIGIAAYLGFEGAVGMAGAVYHFLNHALYKSLLFLMAGAIYYRTHELDMRRLGGLWKKMPLTFLLGMVGVLGIAGIPFFNGYASKLLLFEGIVEVAHHDSLYLLAEIMFLVVSGGTIAYYLKMLRMTFFGGVGEGAKDAGRAPLVMLIPMAVLAVCIGFIGVFPDLVLRLFVYPSLGTFSFDHHAAEHLLSVSFFTPAGFGEVLLVSVIGVAISVIGVAIFGFGWKKNLLFISVPRRWGPDYWYERAGSAMIRLAKGPFATLDSYINARYHKTGEEFIKMTKSALEIDGKIDRAYVEAGETALDRARGVERIDADIDGVYEKTGEAFITSVSGTLEEEKEVSFFREPLSVFDRSAEDFFESLGFELIKRIKYPYAYLTFLIDLIIDRRDTRDVQTRAQEFDKKFGKMIKETPNISGITMAVVIIAGMLTIYLFTATTG
jgi:formate hydrogenlyase subunit 3/multisubunit Na+/H+ antiporter MnhD subunit